MYQWLRRTRSSKLATMHGRASGGFGNAARRLELHLAEMLGLVEGILADGVVTDEEVQTLRDWQRARPEAVSVWPGSVLADRLDRILERGAADAAERSDLANLLQDLVSGKARILDGPGAPVDDPPPSLRYRDQVYVFAGRFALGPREACEEIVAHLGGICQPRVTPRTGYVVVGTFGDRHWSRSPGGRGVRQAAVYRHEGIPVAIVPEVHWAETLP